MNHRGVSPARAITIIATIALGCWYFGETRQTNCYIEECDAILLKARKEAQNSWTASGKQIAWKDAAKACLNVSAPINSNSEYIAQSRRFFNSFYEKVDELPGTGTTLLTAAAGFAAGYCDAQNGTNFTPQVISGASQADARAQNQAQSLTGLINQYQEYTRNHGFRTYQAL